MTKTNRKMGRPAIFESRRFNLKELSADVAQYIDDTKGEKSRRVRLEEIVREHRDCPPMDQSAK